MLPRISVFKHNEDLVQLGRGFYGSPEDQNRALSRAKALEVRGPLPASVHVTCLVVSAIHGDVPANDMYTIRLAYAMALIRFVNEILDSAQQGRTVVPLHTLARELDLPNAFVELRHAATHESLPSVYLLRDMANRALDWLYSNFWALQSPSPRQSSRAPSSPLISGTVEAADHIKELLRQWRRQRRQNLNAPLGVVETQLVKDLGALRDANPSLFCSVLLKRNVVVPAGTGPVAIKPTLMLWMPLLTRLGPALAADLATEIAHELGQYEWPVLDATVDRRQPALVAWLEAMVPDTPAAIVSTLRSLPRPWNARALALWASHNRQPSVMDMAHEMAAVTGATLPVTEVPTTALSSDLRSWRRVQNWSARPLGVI